MFLNEPPALSFSNDEQLPEWQVSLNAQFDVLAKRRMSAFARWKAYAGLAQLAVNELEALANKFDDTDESAEFWYGFQIGLFVTLQDGFNIITTDWAEKEVVMDDCGDITYAEYLNTKRYPAPETKTIFDLAIKGDQILVHFTVAQLFALTLVMRGKELVALERKNQGVQYLWFGIPNAANKLVIDLAQGRVWDFNPWEFCLDIECGGVFHPISPTRVFFSEDQAKKCIEQAIDELKENAECDARRERINAKLGPNFPL